MSAPLTAETALRLRVQVALGLFALLLLAIAYKAFELQLVDGDRYRKRAKRQVLKEVKLAPKRGPIVDRRGTRLAVSVAVPSVWANPRQLGKRGPEVAAALAKILDADRYLLTERLTSSRYFVWVKRRITPAQARAIKKLRIKGIHLTGESRRFYPNRRLAGAVVGFAGVDGRGLEGIEKYFDSWLRGSRSTIAGLRDAHGRAVFIKGRPDITPSAGHTVVLTLDKKLQFITERALLRSVELYQAKGGTAVVLDPHSGDILAMASAPDYDPNNYGSAEQAALRNRAVTDAYEPGSTLKIFTMAAAIESRVVRQGEKIYAEGGMIEIGRHKIKDSHPYKWLTPTECIQKSSNICVTKIAWRLGKRRLYTALRMFGFGHRTGIRLPGERRGHLSPWRRWSEAKLSNVSFGQGMTSTSVQLAAALGALANGGTLYRPRIVRAIKDGDGRAMVRYRRRGRRVISRATARRVIEMMRTVVHKGGTGEDARVPGYEVAGKTGTAQKVAETKVRRAQARLDALARGEPLADAKKKTKGYAEDLYLASFIGVIPAGNPRLAIVVTIDEPKGRHYGGEVAGPVFREVAEQAMRYLGVPPEQPLVPSDAARRKRFTVAKLLEGGGPVLEPGKDPAPPLPSPPASGPAVTMPDLKGLGMTAVLNRLRRLGMRCAMRGSGRVVHQSPAPGPSARGARCTILFAPPG